jgi:inner membrane protein
MGIGACFHRSGIPARIWITGAFCSALPDLDVIGFRFGVHYGDFWGHRGFTHSLLFAAVLATTALVLSAWRGAFGMSTVTLWTFFFLAAASHGFLDAMTDGGLGVAFFSPFDDTRYFLPFTPIRVSPIGISRFFTARGFAVIRSELLWIWLPTALLIVVLWAFRAGSHSPASSSSTN